jgi:hypothetical protein
LSHKAVLLADACFVLNQISTGVSGASCGKWAFRTSPKFF